MPDEIAELTQLMETYRSQSEVTPLLPVAAAYAEAANDLQEMIVELKAASLPGTRLPVIRT